MPINSLSDSSNLFGPKGNLGDYRHASKTFVSNDMRLAPKVKYLYHVVLNINPGVASYVDESVINGRTATEISLLAKSVDLPKYRLQSETVNQYNRKKVLHTGVQYQPVVMEFHDDNRGLSSLLWQTYFSYYYQDSRYGTKTGNSPSITERSYQRSVSGLNSAYGTPESQTYRYGLDAEKKIQNFFTSIQVFQLHPIQGVPTYTSFTLLNPIIDSFEHDTLSYDASEFVVNRMSLSYESVQYARGYQDIDSNIPKGFGDPAHYDLQPSSLNRSIPRQTNINAANTRKNTPAQTRAFIESLSAPSKTIVSQTTIETNTLGNIEFPTQKNVSSTTEAVQKTF